jgi:hypothetical protein
MKLITLHTKDVGCGIAAEIDPDYSGVLLFCASPLGHKLALSVDAGLLKQFCNDVAKEIKHKACKANERGGIKHDTIEDD